MPRIEQVARPGRVRTTRPRAQLRAGRTDWYRITNYAGAQTGTAEVDIYDEIGYWGVTAADFLNDLRQVTAQQITVRLNSPGGEIFDGLAIANSLAAHPATVTVQVDSLAASIASVIAVAGGDRVVMMPHSQMMIHDGSGLAIGNAADMREMAELLDAQSNNIAAVYASKAGGSVEDWRAVMVAETWYTAEEAVVAGLADEVAELPGRRTNDGEAATPKNSWDLSLFRYAGRAAAPAPVNTAAAPAPDPEAEPAADASLTTTVEDALGSEAAAALREHVTEPEADEADPAAAVAELAPADERQTEATTDDAEPEPAHDWGALTAHLTTAAPDPWAALTAHLTPSPSAATA